MALSFNSPTPRRLRRPHHPNLFLLGFSTGRSRGRGGQGGRGAGGQGAGRAAIEVEGLKRRPPTVGWRPRP